MFYITDESEIAEIHKVTMDYNCQFENRKLTKVFLHRQTIESDVLDEYILGNKFQTVLLDKGKIA